MTILRKSARSLSHDRLTELFEELRHQHWDIVMVNETWRTEAVVDDT